MANRSLGSLTIDMLLKTIGLEQGMDRATKKVKAGSKEMESSMTKAARGIVRTISGIVAGLVSVEAAFGAFNNAVTFADRLDELSARFDISTEQLSAWGYAAKLTGGDLESLAGVIPKFSKNVADAADANSELGKTFRALGIDVKDAATGQLRTFQDLLPEVADRFKDINDVTLETALAMQLFGRSGAEFLEFLNLGSEGLKTMEDRARDLGIVIDTETAAKAAQFKDRVDDLRAATQGWFTQIASELLPTLTDLTEEMTDFVKEGGDAVTIAQSLASTIRDIADAIRFLGEIGDVFDRIRGGLAGLEKQGNAAFQSLNPANWTPEGLSRLKEQYDQGTEFIESGWKAMRQAEAQGRRAFEDDGKRRVRGGAIQGESSQRLGVQAESPYDAALRKLLEGDPTKPKGGKSQAEKDAESLFRAYDSLAASLDQQISLYGETTEAARVRYEVEFGNLVNLDPKLKQYLVLKAEELDVRKALVDQQKEEDELAKKELERIERGLQDGALLLEDLGFELALLKMTNEERDTAIQLRGLEAEAVAKYGDAIREANEAVYEEMQRIEIMDGIRDGFSNFFQDVISGTESVTDAFKNMLDDINAQILRRITDNWVEMLFGATGSSAGGASGNWLSIFAGMFGGGRANGGWANANTLYEVNERGLEMATVNGRDYMLTGNSPVHVTPNHKLGGGVQQSNTFVIQGRIDRRTQDQIVQDVGRKTQTAMARNG